MHTGSTLIMESHSSAATLYATGNLTRTNVLQAIGWVQQLPEHIRAICVDLTGVHALDALALRALEAALQYWRVARCGMSRVKLAAATDAIPSGRVAEALGMGLAPEQISSQVPFGTASDRAAMAS